MLRFGYFILGAILSHLFWTPPKEPSAKEICNDWKTRMERAEAESSALKVQLFEKLKGRAQ